MVELIVQYYYHMKRNEGVIKYRISVTDVHTLFLSFYVVSNKMYWKF